MVVLLLAASVAVAQPLPEGTRLFEEGRELAKQGKYDVACEKFRLSLTQDRAPGTTLNYGDCLEHLGQLRKAFQMFDEAARAFERDKDPRAKFARNRAEAVLLKLGTVVIKLADPGAPGLIVEIDRQSVPPLRELTERFDPGEIVVTARVPGTAPFTASAWVVAGATVIIEVPAFRATLTPGETPPSGGVVTGRSRSRMKLVFGLGIGGASALSLSALFGLAAKGQYDRVTESSACVRTDGTLVCTEEAAREIEIAGTRADVSTGFAVVGGVVVAAALVLYVTAPRETLIVAPTASASTAGVTLSGRF